MSAGPTGIPIQICELHAHVSQQVVWSSVATVSFIASQCACQTSNCELCNCSMDMLAGRAASLRLREYFGAEDFAGPELDLSALEPLIALPSSPGNVVPVRDRSFSRPVDRSGSPIRKTSRRLRCQPLWWKLRQAGCANCTGIRPPTNGNIISAAQPVWGSSMAKEETIRLNSTPAMLAMFRSPSRTTSKTSVRTWFAFHRACRDG
jgi:hypothetical protein